MVSEAAGVVNVVVAVLEGELSRPVPVRITSTDGTAVSELQLPLDL